MDEKLIIDFLIKSTVPKVENNNRLKDCIRRAHRDVLAGRFYLPKYCFSSKIIIDDFYSLMISDDEIYSKKYINYLYKKYKVEFGAIQKLVNMTLKYIIILNHYNELNLPVDIGRCDCPLDSKILEIIKEPKIKWTRISEKQYDYVQNKIKNESGEEKIVFDFKNW